ncbi:hypothetical protein HYPSUDRAFT_739272 [Hypholoma sublateritium FD-334 SS-4]|uniref:Transmembrane protein n=1 Tax=Hypholoma sublateritium (strain FD-334 SS-4) TaxID=945553 RepID=A0A0D2NRA5_HYPSF|nr:hypothetical protein HYPSUDRAFT_739272 [Hypholoma sublateritium FD-334 SS-4]
MRCLHPPTLQKLKLIFLSAFLIVGSTTIFSMAATHLAIKPLNFIAPNAQLIRAQIVVTTELLSVDATARTMEMDWYPALGTGCNPDHDFVADLYFNPTPPFTPVYQLNTSILCAEVPVIITPVFRTVTQLLGTVADPASAMTHSSLQEYPFDVYTARISIYALDHDTGEFISLNITHSYGIAVNFEVTLHRTIILNGPNTDNASPLQIDLQVTRSKASKMFVVLVAVSNWLVTAAFLVISAAAMVYPNPHYYNEMFVLPVGVLFAFTSIRTNLPGAPAGFGARIDLFSILPVLVIVTLCSFFLLLIVLHHRLFEREKVKDMDEAEVDLQTHPLPILDDISCTLSIYMTSQHSEDSGVTGV